MTKTTIEHKVIQEWAEKYHALPQRIDDKDSKLDVVGLRLNFPGTRDEMYALEDERILQDISWDDFFVLFEKMQFAFEYEENPLKRDVENAYHFFHRDSR